jgi:hypothetical protein
VVKDIVGEEVSGAGSGIGEKWYRREVVLAGSGK